VSRLHAFLARLAIDRSGAALIETAVLAPTLILMCVGGFEVSAIVARQSELQSTAEQAVEIAIAVSPTTEADLSKIEDILEGTSDLSDARVTMSYKYRCGTEETLSTIAPTCSEDALSTYISIAMTDEYQPLWTQFGFGNGLEYSVNRTVQVS
jgi:Flp pilus assembly protein TadG